MMDDPIAQPVVDVRPLRFVWFGRSIVSDLGNPAATTTRAFFRALVGMGQHAVFLEERGNQPVTDLLRAHGSKPLRAFNRQFPEIVYRTYELPGGRERLVWLGRELSVADVVIVQDTAPSGVVDAIRQGTANHVVRVAQLTTAEKPPFDADLISAPIGSSTAQAMGPAVSTATPQPPTSRQGVIVVAYGDLPLAITISERLASLAPELVTAGPVATAEIPFVPEVDLPARYAGYHAAIIVGAGSQPLAVARALLPMAAGCATFAAGDFPSEPAIAALGLTINRVSEANVTTRVMEGIAALPKEHFAVIPPQFLAVTQAGHFVREVRAIRFAARANANGSQERAAQA